MRTYHFAFQLFFLCLPLVFLPGDRTRFVFFLRFFLVRMGPVEPEGVPFTLIRGRLSGCHGFPYDFGQTSCLRPADGGFLVSCEEPSPLH